MNDIENILKSKFNELNTKKSTMEVYINSFKRIIRDVFNNELPNMSTINDDINIKQIMDYIYSDKVTMSSKKTILNGLINCFIVLEIDLSKLKKEFKKVIRITSNERVYTKPSETELKHKKSLKYIIMKRDLYKNLLKADFQKVDIHYVLLCLYTYLPPLRGEDYYNSLLLYDSNVLTQIERKEKNYLCLKEKLLVINKYKTVDIYGIRIISIPNELIEILNNFKKKSDSQWIICTIKGNKLGHENFYKLMTEAFGEKISSSMMRKIYISSEIIDGNMTAEERKKLSYIMGHSVEQQQLTYSKFSEKLHPNENIVK